ncbi:MAG: hypothetical protein CME19_25690 [Gemmatimonadetes bacterium]|nr:hypothetical protein [Gemmatimonadota bacterium]
MCAPSLQPEIRTRSAPTPDHIPPFVGPLSGAATSQDCAIQGQIVLQTRRDGNDEIYFTEADGSGQIRLTSNASGEQNPAWSPDGYQIVYQTDRDGNWNI